MAQTIDLTPTWNAAVRVFVRLLMDPGVDIEAKQYAESELLRLADAVDASTAEVTA